MLRRWVEAGDTVEWFAAGFSGAPAATRLDGIQIVRAGRQWSVHLEAMRRYRRQLRHRFDVVIDEVNTVPFFTPLWAAIPSVLLIHQLAREVWWYESPFPLNALGYALEPWYLRLYRRTAAFTVSASTRDDLVHLGLRGPITIIHNGVEPLAISSSPPPAEAPTFIYVGRLAASKRVHEVLDAFSRYRATERRARLFVVGEGTDGYTRRLHRLAETLGIGDAVDFLGRLPVEEKHDRMARAHALLMTSVREGWGLVVTEAGACGTPSIVYDVPGLRDSVRNEETGLVVAPSPDRMAGAMHRIVEEPGLRGRLAAGARQWSQGFSYDVSARLFRDTLAARLR